MGSNVLFLAYNPKVQQEVMQESELVSDINKTLASFTLDEKSNGSCPPYDPLEEPTRDLEAWLSPPLRSQSSGGVGSGPTVAGFRSVANRRPPNDGPRNLSAQGVIRGSNKGSLGKTECCFAMNKQNVIVPIKSH